MKKKVFRLLLVALATCISPAFAQKGVPAALLRGTVRDFAGLVIPNARVTIKAPDFLKEVMTSPTGEYLVELTPGIYNIEAVAPFGFSTTYRAPLNFAPGKDATIDFVLYSKMSVVSEYDPPPTEPLDDVPFSDFKYEHIRLETKQGPRSVTMRYGIKDLSNGEEWYRSGSMIERGKNDPGITFTYNFLTVTANKIRIDAASGTVFASGRVTIENGSETKTYDRDVRVVVDGETTIVTLEIGTAK